MWFFAPIPSGFDTFFDKIKLIIKIRPRPMVSVSLTVNAPTPKAKTSVSEVTVMATPACLMVVAILSFRSDLSLWGWFSWHCGE